jgi:hypothetical protein
MVQIKAYCYVLEVDRACLWAFFVNGDYRGSGPQIKCWEIYFTPRELHDNWQLILVNARDMEREESWQRVRIS